MKTLATLMLVSIWPLALSANPPIPHLNDYVEGLALQIDDLRPIQSLPLPDRVYAGVMRSDLGDLRVFNRQGLSVPHALCPGPTHEVRAEGRSQLPLFRLPTAVPSPDATVELKTAAGTHLRVLEPAGASPGAAADDWIIDAGGLPAAINVLELDWQSAATNSEATLRIRTSDNLDHWRDLVAATTILRSRGTDGLLERSRLPLPASHNRYLRIEVLDRTATFALNAVHAHWLGATAEPALQHLIARPLPQTESRMFDFDTGRQAPVQRAWPRLPMTNMLLRVALDSRSTRQAAWQNRWTGEAYELALPDGQMHSSQATFSPVTDRWWRIRILSGGESLGRLAPQLELAYQPATLRFLAQGEGPFILAYGSARAAVTPALRCSALLASAQIKADSDLIGSARLLSAEVTTLGGAAARRAPPQPWPWRLILLWSVLIGGCALVLAMAWKLLGALRPD